MKPISSSKIMRFAALIVLLLLGAGLFPPAGLAAAQSESLQMKATAAYNGYFKYGEWIPVMVELSNQGRDLEAEIRIQVNSSQGALIFSSPVSLPSGSRKLVPVYVLPNNFSRELDVKLVSGDKALVSQKVPVRPQPNISYFIGLLAPERGALALLNGVRFPGQERPKILVDLTLADMPERAEGMRSFDLLVINDVDTSKLTPDQAIALAGWVQQGGRLVIGGGAGAQQTISGLPETLLPFVVQNTAEVGQDVVEPLAQFAGSDPLLLTGTFIAARGELKDSQALLSSGDLPLIVERGWGSGAVNFVAFDLAGVPFNGWPGTQAFWEALIGPSGAYPENLPFDVSPRQFRANSLFYALSNIPSLDLPSIKGLSILLFIYVLVVGPINYLVLRWRRRLHFAWITIPVITLLFAVGAFGIGYTMRGNDLILNKIALVETKSDGNAAVTSYMGLFSPRMQSYEVSVQGQSLISPMTGYDSGPWGPTGQSNTSEMVFVQGQPSKVKGLTVNQWAMQSFMSEGTWEDFGHISGDLRIENETLVGKVRNDSSYTLTEAVLVMQNRFVNLGDLAPGAEKEISLGLSNLQSDRFGPPLSYRLFQERFTTGPMPRALELKSNIVSSVFENGPMMKLMSSSRFPAGGSGAYNGVLVFGWLEEAPPAVEVADNRLTQKATALVYSGLDYQLPETGILTLPAGLIPGSVTEIPVNGGTCGVTTSVHMSKGQAEFEFQIPGDLKDLSVNTLKLAMWRDSGGAVGMPSLALFDWNNQSWTSIQDPIQGTNVVQKASPFVNENGVIRIQLVSEGDTFGCIYLDLGLEAERLAGQGG